MPVALIGVAVAAAAAAGSAAAKQDAERKAGHIQEDAINAMDPMDVDKIKQQVTDDDVAFYKRSLDEFRKNNPELASAKDVSAAGLQKAVEGADAAFTQAEGVFQQRVDDARKIDPVAEEIREQLLVQTRDNLRRGATLPPEFQAELVRSGLEASGTTGVGASRQGPVSARLGTVLGSAGLQLEAQRRAEAGGVLQLDDALNQSRSRILGDLVSQGSALPGARAGFFGSTYAALEGQVKPIGLTGRDIAQLNAENLAFERSKTMSLAKLEAQAALSKGQATSSYLQAGGQLAGGVLGAAGGAGGFSSLFGGGAGSGLGNQVVSSPLLGTVSAPIGGGKATFNRTKQQQANFNYQQSLYE